MTSPTPSPSPRNIQPRTVGSRIWIILVPLFCALYYMHVHGVHLQLHSIIDSVYSEHIQEHISLLNDLAQDIFSQKPFGKLSHSQEQPLAVHDSDSLRPFTRHIVAVGDLHGDYPNALRVLNFSGVVDGSGDWSGNVDFFVQTGDIIDRGDDTIKLFTWMDKLREQAHATGGVVLSHLGNHEWMNVIGDWRYVYPSEIETFGSVEARQRMLSTGRIGRSWANNYTTASRLPLHPYLGPPNTPYPPAHTHSHFAPDFDGAEQQPSHVHESELENGPLSHAALSFVHGGLSPTYKGLVPFPTKINEIGTSLLRKLQRREQPPPHPPYPYPGMPSSTTTEEYELYNSDGPVWYRGWALESEDRACADVDEVLKKTGTRRMIMGHTPDFHNIVSRCNGKIIIIDTGISHAYGGVLSALSIHYTFTPIIDVEHSGAHQRWQEREVVSALYPDYQSIIVDEQREVVGNFTVWS